ncbi:DUF4184 family protein [Promicromonospora sp. MEB111]|nr:DUF4184 family protein [Promicromonospora sp. MEB111]
MPFTLSHPAAVLPLLRHPFSAAAIGAGAVVSDLPDLGPGCQAVAQG